ncbi:MAG: hypothetical protein ABSE06_21195 [Anaerolineaceae bacterium]
MTAQFFQQQLDYILFFYGLAFILLAAVCVEMRGDPGRRLPWIWLAGFGLVHGISQWLEMLVQSEGESPVFSAVRLALMTISFILLFEFGREGLRRLTGKSLGRWIYIPLLVCLLPAILAGIAGLNAAARYAFGLTGGLWAAWTVFQLSKIRPETRRSLYTASVLLAVYAVAAGIIVPEAPFLPASLINQAAFQGVTGVPIQLVCGILAMAITAAVWSYSRQTTLSAHRAAWQKCRPEHPRRHPQPGPSCWRISRQQPGEAVDRPAHRRQPSGIQLCARPADPNKPGHLAYPLAVFNRPKRGQDPLHGGFGCPRQSQTR